jgi:hypothetical protein
VTGGCEHLHNEEHKDRTIPVQAVEALRVVRG